MRFAEPKPFREALQSREIRNLLPTDLRTRELALLEPAVRERAVFSAGVTSAELLQEIDDSVDALLRGASNRAEQRTRIKGLFGWLAGDADQTDLTDIRSTARLNLILDTQLAQAQGYGQWAQGQDPDILDRWPAQELVRVRNSREPRDWAERWADAGGTFFGQRMIALKNSPVWTKISRFGLPYPPFDFNSGMDVVDVDRETAEEAGLLSPEERVAPAERGFNADLQATPEVRASWLIEAIGEALQGVAAFDRGVLRLIGGAR